MKTKLHLKSILSIIVISLELSYGSLAQIYQYSDNNSGTPFSVNINATGGNLIRGSGLNNTTLTCNGSNDGFGSKDWSSGTASTISTANTNGKFVSIIISPKVGYKLNITDFQASFRSPSSPSGAPTTVRFAYLENGAGFTENGASINPGTSAICSNAGLTGTWTLPIAIETINSVELRIFGFNASSATAEMYLKSININGSVVCNPAIVASIAPVTPAICVNNAVTLTGSASVGSLPGLTHAWSIVSGGSFGTLSSPTTNATNLITGTGVGAVNTQYTVSYGSSPSCSVSATKAVSVTPLPTLTPNLNPQVCLGTATTNLSYTGVIGTPNVYSLNFDAAAEVAGFVDALNQTFSFGSSGNISFAVPTVSPIAAGTYHTTLVIENTSTGCESQVYNIIITVHALPVVSITGASSVCEGSTTPLAGISSPSAVTSSWLSSTSTVATVSSLGVVSGLLAGNTNITFTLTDANGCTNTTALSNIVVNPLPTGILTFTETSGTTNDGTVCSGDAVTFTAPSGYTNYNFKINGVSMQNGISNTYSSSFTVSEV